MDYRQEFRVEPKAKVKLKKLDPAYTGKHAWRDEAKQEIEDYQRKLFEQQALLYAEHKHSILVVLQALDAGGKDGTIKHVFAALNPQGVKVASFKQPTPAELAHDFLWRVHPHAPGNGRNRHLQPLALRGRARAAGPQTDRQGNLDDALPAHSGLRGPAGPERRDDPQVLPAHQQAGTAGAVRPTPRRSERATGRSANPIIRKGRSGTITSRPWRTRSRRPAPKRRRGT